MTDIKELALRLAKERMPDMPDEWYAEEVERGVRLIAAYCAEQEPVSLYPCGFKELNSLVIKNGAYLARGMYEGEPVTESIRSAAMVLIGYAKDMSILLAKQPLYAAPPEPAPAPKETALSMYKRFEVEYETADPVERLRAFCSFAMDGQDWLDVEPFFNALTKPAPQQKFPAKSAGPEDQKIYDSIAANYNKGAAPSSKEVREMPKGEYTWFAAYCSLKKETERLAARVPDGCVVVPKDLIDAAKNLLAVKGRHHTELAYKQLCQALIAAGEVKPC